MLDEEKIQRLDGPVRENNPEVVPTRSAELLHGFEWVTMDLNDEKQVIIFKFYRLRGFSLTKHYIL